MFTKIDGIEGLADAAKNILEGRADIYELVASLSKEGAADFMGAAAKAKEAGKDEFEFGGKTYPVKLSKDVADKISKAMGEEEEEDIQELAGKPADEVAYHSAVGVGEEMPSPTKHEEADEDEIDETDEEDEAGEVEYKNELEVTEALDRRERANAQLLIKQINQYYRNMDKAEKFAMKNTKDLAKVERPLGGMIADLKRDFHDSSRFVKSVEKIVGRDKFFDFKEFSDDAYDQMVSAESAFEEHVRMLKDNDPDAQETLDIFLEEFQSANKTFGEFLREAFAAIDEMLDEAKHTTEGFTDEEVRALCHSKDHDCATIIEHPEFGLGKPVHGSHAIPDDNGFVEWYDVEFKHGIEKKIYAENVKVIASSHHMKDDDEDPSDEDSKNEGTVLEGKMKELHGYIEAGMTADEIIKAMKLKKTPDMKKFIQGLMKK